MTIKSTTNSSKTCSLCGKKAITISAQLGVCKECILNEPKKALPIVQKTRTHYRKEFSLPIAAPKNPKGLTCGDCVNNCKIGKGEIGFCGLVKNINDELIRVAGDEESGGLFSYYYDPLPTNCVANPFCAGCTGAGYPKFTNTDGAEYSRNNLAVFYQACTFDCLFCQNYQYRREIHTSKPRKPNALIEAISDKTSCICFFGGDPSAQIKHSNAVGMLALEKGKKEERIIRVCWETNGSSRPALLQQSAAIALKTGGIIKIDCKTFSNDLNEALCGSSNKFTKYNIKKIGKMAQERPELPLLVVSSLLIPGYIDQDEIAKIAELIANIDPTIPYSLLAFYPTFVINDLPKTSKKLAKQCYQAAKEQGLVNVHIGNKHLLW